MDKIKDLRREIFNEMNTWQFSAAKKEQVKKMVDEMVAEANLLEDKTSWKNDYYSGNY